MYVLNFGHKIDDEQVEKLKRLLGRDDVVVVDIPVQIQHEGPPLAEQIRAIVATAAQRGVDLETDDIMVRLPGLADAATAIVAEIAGYKGHLPAIVNYRAIPGSLPQKFEPYAITNLQAIRDEARARRPSLNPAPSEPDSSPTPRSSLRR